MSSHTIGIGHVCVTQSNTFRYARLRCAEDNVLWQWRPETTAQWGHRTTNTKQLLG